MSSVYRKRIEMGLMRLNSMFVSFVGLLRISAGTDILPDHGWRRHAIHRSDRRKDSFRGNRTSQIKPPLLMACRVGIPRLNGHGMA